MGSEPLILQGIQHARDAGKIAVTSPLKLIIEKRNEPGFVVFAPVYKKGYVSPHRFETIKTPIFDEEHNIAGLVGISRDITDQKLSENFLRLSEEKYKSEENKLLILVDGMEEGIVITDPESRITVVNRWFVDHIGLDRKDGLTLNLLNPRSGDELIDDLKHVILDYRAGGNRQAVELNRQIMGLAELALNTGLKTEQREYLDDIITASNALLTVVNDILDLSKIEAGQLELINVEFDIRKLIDNAASLLAVTTAKKGIELISYMAPEMPPILMGDPGRLRQVLVNLLGNAVKFTDSGEVVLMVGSQQLENDMLYLHFSVKDTGIGIPPEKTRSIFQRSAFRPGWMNMCPSR